MSNLLKWDLFLKYFGFFKVPLVGQVKPKIISLDEKQCILNVPLCRKTKNHLNSMYFGAINIGAEAAAGILAFKKVHELKAPVSIIFKDYQANFHKRAVNDVHFICNQGEEITNTIMKAMNSNERENIHVGVIATTPKASGDEVVASFHLTISFKKKDK